MDVWIYYKIDQHNLFHVILNFYMYYDYNDIPQGVLISQLYDVFVKLVGELLIVFSIKKNVAHHLTTIIGKMSFF